MKHLQVRHQHVSLTGCSNERLRRAVTIILEHQEEPHASRTFTPESSTPNQQQEGTIASQVHASKH